MPPRSNYSGKKRLLFWLGVNIWPSLKQIRTGSYKNKHISAKSDFVYVSCWNHLEFMERFVITTRPLVYRACLLYLFIFLLLFFFYSTGIFLSFNRFPFWPIESNNTRWVSTGYGWQKPGAARSLWQETLSLARGRVFLWKPKQVKALTGSGEETQLAKTGGGDRRMRSMHAKACHFKQLKSLPA